MANEKTFLVSEEELNEGLNDKMPKSGNGTASGENSFALGENAKASGEYGLNLSIGADRGTSDAYGMGSVVLRTAPGRASVKAYAHGERSMVLGLGEAYGTSGIVISNNADTKSLYKKEIVIGGYNKPYVTESTYAYWRFIPDGETKVINIPDEYIVDSIISVRGGRTYDPSEYTISNNNHTITFNTAPIFDGYTYQIDYNGTFEETIGNILTIGGDSYIDPYNAFEVKNDGNIVIAKNLSVGSDVKVTKSNGTKVSLIDLDTKVSNITDPMVFKGSLGTNGTITSLPAAAASNKGFVYKVITNGTYASQSAKSGDTFISDGNTWVLIPSGDEPNGTVTSVTVKMNGATKGTVTTSGTIDLGTVVAGQASTTNLGGVKVGYGLDIQDDGTLYVGKGSTEGMGLDVIPGSCFKGNTSLTEYDIKYGIWSIGESAFQNCTNLASINIPDNISFIGQSAFQNCTNLASIILPSNITTINAYLFSHSGITSITIPDSVTSIGDYAFNGCNKLESISIPDSVTSIPLNSFFGNLFSLKSLLFPDNCTINLNSQGGMCDGTNTTLQPMNLEVINIPHMGIPSTPSYYASFFTYISNKTQIKTLYPKLSTIYVNSSDYTGWMNKSGIAFIGSSNTEKYNMFSTLPTTGTIYVKNLAGAGGATLAQIKSRLQTNHGLPSGWSVVEYTG